MAERGPAPYLNRPILLGSLAFGMLQFMLPVYSRQLGASALAIGGLFSGFSLVLLLTRPLTGWAMDRFGRKPFFVAGLFGYAAAMALFALAGNLVVLYLARIVQGLASSLLWVSAYTLSTEMGGESSRGASVGRVDEASSQGGFYGTFLGFTLLGVLGMRRGWPTMFGIYAVLAAVGAWMALRRVPETQRVIRAKSATAFRISGQMARVLIIVFLSSLAAAMVSPLIVIYLKDLLGTEVWLLALAFIPAALIASYIPSHMGRTSDRIGRVGMMAGGLAVAALATLVFTRTHSFPVLIAAWALQALGFASSSPAQEAMVADITPFHTRGRGYGLFSLAGSMGGVIGPLLGGWLYDRAALEVPFLSSGALLIITALLVIVLRDKNQKGQSESNLGV